MLFTVVTLLLGVGMLGLVSGYTFGNLIYALLVAGLVLFVMGVFTPRRGVV
jgi:hypothetical protein